MDANTNAVGSAIALPKSCSGKLKLEAQVGQKSLAGLGWSWYVILCHGGHLGYQIRLPLAIHNLMLFEEFQDCNSEALCRFDASHQVPAQSTYGLGGDVVWRISRWPPWQPSWILNEMILAILILCVTVMHPIKFWLNPTYGLGDVVWRISRWPP